MNVSRGREIRQTHVDTPVGERLEKGPAVGGWYVRERLILDGSGAGLGRVGQKTEIQVFWAHVHEF